jgi:hypothetical protein
VAYNVYRLGGFYLISVGIGGLASILAYGLMQMEGVGGLRGWRWIFIIGQNALSSSAGEFSSFTDLLYEY